jgi:biopolymer transport protein TolQ
MEVTLVDAAQASEGFTFLALFMRADLFVKGVMGLLAFMSIWSWAIAIDKMLQLRSLHSKSKVFERDFWSGRPLASLAEQYAKTPKDPYSRVFAASLREWKGKKPGGRVAKAAGAEAGRELSNIETGLGILATIASSAPFVGLLGTVWGIMNAFIAIGATQSTDMAVIAPGIAEALFATALGLMAAIPAVVFFNTLTANLSKYGSKLDGFVDDIAALADREVE